MKKNNLMRIITDKKFSNKCFINKLYLRKLSFSKNIIGTRYANLSRKLIYFICTSTENCSTVIINFLKNMYDIISCSKDQCNDV